MVPPGNLNATTLAPFLTRVPIGPVLARSTHTYDIPVRSVCTTPLMNHHMFPLRPDRRGPHTSIGNPVRDVLNEPTHTGAARATHLRVNPECRNQHLHPSPTAPSTPTLCGGLHQCDERDVTQKRSKPKIETEISKEALKQGRKKAKQGNKQPGKQF
jgi:hypothetical protein